MTDFYNSLAYELSIDNYLQRAEKSNNDYTMQILQPLEQRKPGYTYMNMQTQWYRPIQKPYVVGFPAGIDSSPKVEPYLSPMPNNYRFPVFPQ